MANLGTNPTVKFTLKYKDGNAAANVAVKAIREADPLLAATMAVADIVDTTASASGVVTLNLPATDAIPVTYKVVLSDGQYFYITLPKNAKSCHLGIFTVSKSPTTGVKNITASLRPSWVGQTITAAATIVPTCNVHLVSGDTNITAITATDYPIGQLLTLIFSGTPSVSESSTLKLAGTFTGSGTNDADALTLVYDGSAFYEVCRSAN